MSSTLSFKAQPLTRTFVITQGPDQTGVYYFTKENVDSWFESNMDDIRKVSGSFYIITGSFVNTMNNLNYEGTWDGRKSLIDFGKEIIFGNERESRLIVLRRVQFFGDASAGADGHEGYVVVENNTTNLAPSDWGRFTVRVARA